MREILFKAKRKDNGKWVEGYYCKMSETTYCFKEGFLLCGARYQLKE